MLSSTLRTLTRATSRVAVSNKTPLANMVPAQSLHSCALALYPKTKKMPKEGTSSRRRKEDADGHAEPAPATTKKTKAKKDPNAPKRSLSAYMFFANENREDVRSDNPGITFGQIGKVLGERWKALSDEDRKPYGEKAEQDKKRYEAEMEAFKAGNTSKLTEEPAAE